MSMDINRNRVKHYNEHGHAHMLTFSWFMRQRFLSQERPCLYLKEAIDNAREKYIFDLWAYVFMPEHVHLLIWPGERNAPMSDILKTIKQSSARKAINHLRKYNPEGLKLLATGQESHPYRFWLDGPGHDGNIITLDRVHNEIDYLHNNSVRRGLVSNPVDWYWSSAREWLEEGAGPIRIDRISVPVV